MSSKVDTEKWTVKDLGRDGNFVHMHSTTLGESEALDLTGNKNMFNGPSAAKPAKIFYPRCSERSRNSEFFFYGRLTRYLILLY